MTIIAYALLPITLLWVSYLLHKRGTKSHLPHCEDWGEYRRDVRTVSTFFPQEKNHSSTTEGEEE